MCSAEVPPSDIHGIDIQRLSISRNFPNPIVFERDEGIPLVSSKMQYPIDIGSARGSKSRVPINLEWLFAAGLTCVEFIRKRVRRMDHIKDSKGVLDRVPVNRLKPRIALEWISRIVHRANPTTPPLATD